MIDERVGVAGDRPVNPDGDYVLYWMIAARRTRWSWALDRALTACRALGKPLLVLEPLRIGHRWASPRIHRFVTTGMADQAAAFAKVGVTYLPYVEPRPGDGQGLLAALSARACLVVTDTFPCFFLPAMVAAAGRRSPVLLEEVDGNGVLPLAAAGRAFPTAHALRRHLHRALPAYLDERPAADPLAGYDLGKATLPAGILDRWPTRLDVVPADGPGPVPIPGGSRAAEQQLDRWLDRGLARYPDRNDPDAEVESGLSPYLHFGHLSAHEVVRRVLDREEWTADRLGKPTGSRTGWWGVSPAAEGYLDQIVTWRELGYTFCRFEPRYDRFDTLPPWALQTLDRHRDDPRPVQYPLDRLVAAETGDPVWNAAQRQLVAEGRIHNYLRMVWGKRILEWGASPEAAWDTLIELNNRFAIDGRDPNSYSGIAWTFGRFDRAWGPERPIFGTVRYMSSDNTLRKLSLDRWFERWGRT
ncbi:MAG: deoxyribodipyrimidine photolyase [Myxococcota bacterium]